jgi:thiamine pyrophosphate-dependent acetolactate synthase large subunit-like protein
LVTVGAVAPKNLTVLLIQNGVHAASGGQALTNANLDFAEIGRTMGLAHTENIASAVSFRKAIAASLKRPGPSMLVLATEPDLKAVMPPMPLDPMRTKQRFSEAIGAPRYVSTFFGGGKLVTP